MLHRTSLLNPPESYVWWHIIPRVYRSWRHKQKQTMSDKCPSQDRVRSEVRYITFMSIGWH